MPREKRWITSEVLFTAISEELADHKQASFTVTGMSMWPFLCHGRDQVIVEAANPCNIKVGDIILLKASEGHYLLHRVTKCGEECLETTGDGNFYRDGFFPFDCVTAKVGKVIRKGKMIDCNHFIWKILSQIWMRLFVIRRYIFALWFRIRK